MPCSRLASAAAAPIVTYPSGSNLLSDTPFISPYSYASATFFAYQVAGSTSEKAPSV